MAPRPADGDPVRGEPLLGDLDRVQPAAGDRGRDPAALVEGAGVRLLRLEQSTQTNLVRVETQLSGFVPSIQMITRVNLPSEPTSKKLQLCIFVVPFR